MRLTKTRPSRRRRSAARRRRSPARTAGTAASISAALRPMPLSVTVNTSRTRPRAAGSAAAAKRDAAALGEFHRIVGEVFQRRAQPQRVARDHRRQIGRDRRSRPRCPCCRRARRAPAPTASASARGENGSWRSVRPVASALRGIDDQRGQRGEMLGAALDARAHSPFALAEIGGGEQLGQRHDAGERRADVVRDAGERGLDRARRRRLAFAARLPRLARALRRLRLCALAIRPPSPGAKHATEADVQSSPTRRRISAGVNALRAQFAQARGLRRFRQLAAVGVEDQPVMVIARRRQAEQRLQQRGARWWRETGPARAPRR